MAHGQNSAGVRVVRRRGYEQITVLNEGGLNTVSAVHDDLKQSLLKKMPMLRHCKQNIFASIN